MNPLNTLKLCSVMFAVLWTGWMLWSSGELAAANIAILTIVGAVAGYLWFVGMRWFFRRIGHPQRLITGATCNSGNVRNVTTLPNGGH